MTLKHPGKPRLPWGSRWTLRWRWCNAGHWVVAYTLLRTDRQCRFHREEDDTQECGGA